jgi:hypothetical protein
VYEYLRTHPSIFMCRPKEPNFWADDFPLVKQGADVKLESLADYLALFNAATPSQAVVGEASPIYLFSQRAIPRIHSFSAQAKYIVMLRNPVDMAHSHHAWMILRQVEDVRDFQKAWDLQKDRAHGRHIPKGFPATAFLQYQAVCRLGEQVQRMLSIVPVAQIKFALLDDLTSQPAQIYQEILGFLGLPFDGRTEFPRLNQSRRVRFPVAGSLIFNPPEALKRPARLLRHAHRRDSSMQNKLLDLVFPEQELPPLSPELRTQLTHVFRDDVTLLGELIGRDLSAWQRA